MEPILDGLLSKRLSLLETQLSAVILRELLGREAAQCVVEQKIELVSGNDNREQVQVVLRTIREYDRSWMFHENSLVSREMFKKLNSVRVNDGL